MARSERDHRRHGRPHESDGEDEPDEARQRQAGREHKQPVHDERRSRVVSVVCVSCEWVEDDAEGEQEGRVLCRQRIREQVPPLNQVGGQVEERRPDRTREDVEQDKKPERVAQPLQIGQPNAPSLNDLLRRESVLVEGSRAGVQSRGSVRPVVENAVYDIDAERHATKKGHSVSGDDGGGTDKGRPCSPRKKRGHDERTLASERLAERVGRDGREEARALADDESESEREPEAVVGKVADDAGGSGRKASVSAVTERTLSDCIQYVHSLLYDREG